jgi:pimeloyl-ACP methyl ester carboxylesterase
VVGEAMWRIAPDFAIKDGYENAFAPGFDIDGGFEDPDQVVEDLRAMTFTSSKDARDANDDYRDEIPLDERLRQIPVPLLSIFGSEDQICDTEASQAAYEAVPGAQVQTIEGAGHSPNVEAPEETAALIERYAAEASVVARSRPNKGRQGD